MSSWDTCVGDAAWIHEPLQKTLQYAEPLPVQQVVIPLVSRALLSGIPMDVSLTAPTGSGKTLCYLIPMLRLITEAKKDADDTRLRALLLVPTEALGQQVFREVQQLIRQTSIAAASLCGDAKGAKDEAHLLVRSVRTQPALSDLGDYGGGDDNSSGDRLLFFSRVDVIVATPQRLLHHLSSTPGLSLAALRLLVIDEADQVLAGNFANAVAKVVERFESEADQVRSAEMLYADLHPVFAPLADTGTHTLHKVLCSATLSSRIARISEVRLRNCRYFALDSLGCDVDAANSAVDTHQQAVRTSFALPPALLEHIIFVEDAYRHAVLLKLVRLLLQKLNARHRRPDGVGSAPVQSTGSDLRPSTDAAAAARPPSQESYPSTADDAGTGILIFCSSAEEARVMGHFLTAAGVPDVVEFTTLATDSERRRALLRPSSCVVASDALMRGIDIPNVGHVIMYHPPESLSQYVHRAGRTARAMRTGHLHLLLSKAGPSGGLEDGEVALFKKLAETVTRAQPLRYERHFFLFAAAPHPPRSHTDHDAEQQPLKQAAVELPVEKPSTSTAAPAEATEVLSDQGGTQRGDDEAASPPPDSAEWWIQEANRYLEKSQHQLQHKWTSALQAAVHKKTRISRPASASASVSVHPPDAPEAAKTKTQPNRRPHPRSDQRKRQRKP